MATKIVTKNSSTAGSAPSASDLVQGELAVNVADKRLYTEDNAGNIVELGTNPSTIDINGGTIDGTVIGGNTAAAISGTTGQFSGEITANGGIALGDSDKATFGASDDLQIYHDGSNSYVQDAGTGNLNIKSNGSFIDIQSDSTRINNAANSEIMATFVANGAVTLNYDNSAKLATTSTGIDVTGTATMDGLTVDGATLLDNGVNATHLTLTGTTGRGLEISTATISYTDNTAVLNAKHSQGILSFKTANTERMRLNSDGSCRWTPDGTTPDMTLTADGHLLVGKTYIATGNAGQEFRAGGYTAFTRSGGNPLELNRLTNDGAIATFIKDGATVGSIGVEGGDLYIDGAGGQVKFYISGSNKYEMDGAQFFATTDNANDLGTASRRWDDVYATNGTIQTSDRNEKQDIAELSDAEQRVAVACKGLLRKFRWKDSVAEKGDDARTHFGIIAQDLQAAFEAEGLDAGDYAMFISTTWTDEETNEEKTRMGVRYSELLAFIISAI